MCPTARAVQIQSIPACSKLQQVLFCQSRRWGGSEAGCCQCGAHFSGHWCHSPSVYPVPQWWAFLSQHISVRPITKFSGCKLKVIFFSLVAIVMLSHICPQEFTMIHPAKKSQTMQCWLWDMVRLLDRTFGWSKTGTIWIIMNWLGLILFFEIYTM